MQEVGGVCSSLPLQLPPAPVPTSHATATISLTSAAPRGSRGSSRGSSVGEGSVETETTKTTGSAESTGSAEGEEGCSPMDLSATPVTSLKAEVVTSSPMAFLDDRLLLNPKKFAELFKAQAHQQREQNETTPPSSANLPKKRALSEHLDLHLARQEKSVRSPEGSESSTGSGSQVALNLSNATPASKQREVKKRRLDELLSKKFSDEVEVSKAMTISSPSQSHTLSARRDSGDRRLNRRKRSPPIQAQPSLPSPCSSPSKLVVRPTSELLSPVTKTMTTKNSVDREEVELTEAMEAVQNQIVQLQLAQAALLGGAANAANAANPLLYYSYYAQIVQGIQTQQQKLVEELMTLQKKQQQLQRERQQQKTFKSSTEDLIKRIMSGNAKDLLQSDHFKAVAAAAAASASTSVSASSPSLLASKILNYETKASQPASSLLRSSPSSLFSLPSSVATKSPSGTPTPSGSEPRRRAPRALTGRYVRSGPAASPSTLKILRQKIVERMRLKELLGENSHLYFGALNKQKKGGKHANKR